MVDYQRLTGVTTSYFEHLGDEGANFSADESASCTLSIHSDNSSSSDILSFLHTVQSASPTDFHEENEVNPTSFKNDERRLIDLDSLTPSSVFHDLCSKQARLSDVSYKPLDEKLRVGYLNSDFITGDCLMDTTSPGFMPVKAENATPSKARTPSPGMSKMLLSLSDHPLERPCTPNASSLYRNTKTYCNPSELGQYTYEECMFFTQWANKFLQYSRDHVTITDLARDLGDGLTLLSLVELLTGKFPPQIHIKPALDVQKMENIQACLDFLEQTGVSVNGIAAEDIVQGNLKVVLALCHCLHRIFSKTLYPGPILLPEKTLEGISSSTLHQRNSVSSAVSDLPINTSVSPQLEQLDSHKPLLCRTVDKDNLWLFNWVAKLTGQEITDMYSFQDGTVLCLLLNKITGGGIPNLVLKFGSPAEKVSLALKVSSEKLSIESDLQPEDVLKQRNHCKFITFLKSLHLLYSKKLKRIHEAFERSNLARERKREKLRGQRLKERTDSQRTYHGGLSPKISRFDRERRPLPSELSAAKVSSYENLTKTKDQLEELKNELKLLKLECGDYYGEGGLESQLSSSRPAMSVGSPGKGEQIRSTQVMLRERDHDSQSKFREKTILGNLKESRLFLGERSDEHTSGVESNREGLMFGGCYLDESSINTSRNGLSFGGCYLSESYNSSSKRDLNSSTGQPSSLKALMRNERTFYSGNVTFPPYGSSLARNDWTQRAEDGNGVPNFVPRVSLLPFQERPWEQGCGVPSLKPPTFRKGRYSGCEVVEEDVKGPRPSSIKRMLDAGNLSKLGNDPRFSSDVLLSSRPGNVSLGIETTTAMLPKSPYYSNEQALGEDRSKSPKSLFSSNQAEKDGENALRSPFQVLKSPKGIMGLNESHVQRQRNSSEEKCFRERIRTAKSGRSVEQGSSASSSARTNLQDLTALARMSAKRASALCGEGAHT